MDHQFDFLAKTVALTGGMPRREAVRRVGEALAAVALTSLGVGCSSGGGSSSISPLLPGTSSTRRTLQAATLNCVQFCQQAFPPGPKRGQCISDGAKGTGVCAQCSADITRLCNGVCVNLQTDVNNCGTCSNKCASGLTCTSGACVCPAPLVQDPNNPSGCIPPYGTYRIECYCNDGSRPNFCTNTCAVSICDSICASRGGNGGGTACIFPGFSNCF